MFLQKRTASGGSFFVSIRKMIEKRIIKIASVHMRKSLMDRLRRKAVIRFFSGFVPLQ